MACTHTRTRRDATGTHTYTARRGAAPREIYTNINMSRHEPETYTITLRRTPIRFPLYRYS